MVRLEYLVLYKTKSSTDLKLIQVNKGDYTGLNGMIKMFHFHVLPMTLKGVLR